MSLPLQTTPHQSVNATDKDSSRPNTPSLLPSALPRDKDNDATHLPPNEQRENAFTTPSFTPFFTLIQDINTHENHHPTIHYIFSDDDTDLITEAALRTLDASPPPLTSRSSSLLSNHHHHHDPHTNNDPNTNDEAENDAAPSHPRDSQHALPPPRPGVTDRYILLDLSASLDTVLTARSMTADWQVLSTQVSNAPTWDGAEAEGEGNGKGAGKGLMLRIEGTEGVMGNVKGKEVKEREGDRDRDMGELVGVFEKRMGELRRLVEGVGG
ncbi:hypothetical protein MMC16_004186 [Acarospora aff. strigata]|nr:hypothetical protein [Acarospora aff. strigata]